MGTRRVQNFYIPKDFDPSLLSYEPNMPHKKVEVRMMLPFSLRCSTCGEYMYQGTKFTTTKEKVKGEEYHGIEIHRFFLRCFGCRAIITIRTDPEHMDYAIESGATRNFQLWRDGEEGKEGQGASKKEGEEEEDAMSSLEKRTLQSRKEMEILDGLEAIRSRNEVTEHVDIAEVLRRKEEQREEEERKKREEEEGKAFLLSEEEKKQEDDLVASIRFGVDPLAKKKGLDFDSSDSEEEEEERTKRIKRRLEEEEEESDQESEKKKKALLIDSNPFGFLVSVDEDEGKKKKKKKSKKSKKKKSKKEKKET